MLTELKTESSGDQAEIASEATLFRLSRAGAVTVPGMRSSCPGSSALDPSRTHAHAPPSGHASTAGTRSLPGSGSRPPPNRFPEQIEEDDILSSHRAQSSSSSNDGEMDEVAEAGSDWGAMSVGGYGTEEEEERRSNIVWNGIRGGPGGSAVTVATPTGSTRSPNGSASRGMETDVSRLVWFSSSWAASDHDSDNQIPFAAPQTPSVSAGTRRSKRKRESRQNEAMLEACPDSRRLCQSTTTASSRTLTKRSSGGLFRLRRLCLSRRDLARPPRIRRPRRPLLPDPRLLPRSATLRFRLPHSLQPRLSPSRFLPRLPRSRTTSSSRPFRAPASVPSRTVPLRPRARSAARRAAGSVADS